MKVFCKFDFAVNLGEKAKLNKLLTNNNYLVFIMMLSQITGSHAKFVTGSLPYSAQVGC